MNKFIATVLVIILTKCQNNVDAINQGKDKNLFHAVNDQLRETVSQIFTMLKLNGDFSHSHQHKILLNIHKTMKAFAENNYNIYKEICKTAKCDSDVQKPTKKELHNITKALNELSKEGYIYNQNALYQNQIILNMDMSSLEIPDRFDEVVMNFKEFFSKNNLNFDLNSTVDSRKASLMQIRRNLKIWKATNTSEEFGGRRLFRGKTTRIRKYPFVASIHISGEFQCVGSIISWEMVITAASCLQIAYENRRHVSESPWDVAIRVGSDYAEKYGEWVYASNIMFHPDYDPENLSNNLAIIRIRSSLYLWKSNKKIKRIDFQNEELRSKFPDDFNEIVLVGFGDEAEDTSTDEIHMKSSHLNLYDSESCTEIYSSKYFSKNNFCAGYITKGSGACQRDIGGPAVIGSTLVGVVSFAAPTCGTPDAPTVFTNLEQYTDWINEVINENPPVTSKVESIEVSDLRQGNTDQKHKLTGSTRMPDEDLDTTRRPDDNIGSTKMFIDNQFETSTFSQPIHKVEAFNNFHLMPNTQIQQNYPVTPNPNVPKAVRLLKSVLREFVHFYGQDEFYDTSPNHLWETTTINPKNHSLIQFIHTHTRFTGKTTMSLYDVMKTVYKLPPLTKRNVIRNHFYETSNKDLSIEDVPIKGRSYQPFYHLPAKQSITQYPSPTTIALHKKIFGKSDKNLFLYENGKVKGIDLENLEKSARKILKNNLMKDYTFKWDDESKEFVLVLKTRSTTPNVTRKPVRNHQYKKRKDEKTTNYQMTNPWKGTYLPYKNLGKYESGPLRSLNKAHSTGHGRAGKRYDIDKPLLRLSSKDTSISKDIGRLHKSLKRGDSLSLSKRSKNKAQTVMYVNLGAYNVSISDFKNFEIV